MNHIETDYLIIGSGAVGMAFADTLFHETTARMVIVDRHHGPGGHWNDAYPFVRLHQPSSFYGVNSKQLGGNGRDHNRLNLGMTERASSAEIVSYYEALMIQMVDSGRVQYLPMSNVQPHAPGESTLTVQSILSGALTQVSVANKVVDTTYLNTAVPSTHPPKYQIGAGVTCVPLNTLAKLRLTPTGYVVVGAGKTGIDACLWLLENGVPPEMICWIMPRDSWFQNRANIQSGDDFFLSTFGAMAAQFEAVAAADSVPDLLQRLEASEQLLRLDPAVEPRMYHAAVVSKAELAELRRIKNIVRMGRVQRIDADCITLARGTAPMLATHLVVDCSASAAEARPAKPVFAGNTITPQFIQAFQPTFSAALIAHVEATFTDEATKNKLCTPVPLPDTPLSWLTMQGASLNNRHAWNKAKLGGWIRECRLDGFTAMMDRVEEHETDKIAVMERMVTSLVKAVNKVPVLVDSAV